MSTNTTSNSSIESPNIERDPTKLIAAAIDFGNTAIRAAVLDGSNIVRIVPNKHMEQETLAIVAYTDPITVGREALFCCFEEPEIAIYDLKDMMSNIDLNMEERDWPFEFIELDGKWKIRVIQEDEEQLLTPIEVTKELFQEVIQNLMTSIKEDSIEQLILTIPPYFTSINRKALLDVVQREEFKNVLLMNDVTAVLYRHVMQHRKGEQLKDANYIVYNFGYTSFDCAAFSVRFGKISTKHILNIHVGGYYFTKFVMWYILKETPQEVKAGINWNTKTMARFYHEAEKIKKVLSYKSQVIFKWSSVGTMSKSTVNINAGDMEEHWLSERSKKIITSTQLVLTKSGLNKSDIDQVFLSGGSSRMPFVSKILKSYFDADLVVTSENPEMDAVIGATMYSREIIPERSTYPIRHLLDIRLPNVVAKNIATDQSLVLVNICDDLMRTHIVRSVFKTDSDLINYEISENYPDGGSPVVIAKYSRQLAIPQKEEVTYEFTVHVDQNGIATITNISTFMLRNAVSPIDGNTTSAMGCHDKRSLVDSDEDSDDDDVSVKGEPNIDNVGNKREDNGGADTNREGVSKNEDTDGVENLKIQSNEREDHTESDSNVNRSHVEPKCVEDSA